MAADIDKGCCQICVPTPIIQSIKLDTFKIYYLLKQIKFIVMDNNCWNPKSNSINQVISKEEISYLVNDLKIFGLSTIEANILVELFFNAGLPKSSFQRYSGKSAQKLNDALATLELAGLISRYSELSEKNREVTYYQLSWTKKGIYDYFRRKNSQVIDNIHHHYDNISHILLSPNLNDFDTLVEYLYQLGIVKESAKILAALELDCYEEIFGKKPKSNSSFRPLFQQTGWVYSDNNKLVHLRKPLLEITQDYVNGKELEYSDAEENFLAIIELIESNPEIQREDIVFDDLSVLDKRHVSHIRGDYSDDFIDSIKDIIVSVSSTKTKPFDIELIPPYPKNIRVYLYKNGKSKRHLTDKITEYKTVLAVPGQKSGEQRSLDFTHTTLVILCGYCIEKNLFVFWNSHLHETFSFNANLQVKEMALVKAEIYGYASYTRKLDSKEEKIIIAKPENVKKAILELYEIYFHEIIGDIL